MKKLFVCIIGLLLIGLGYILGCSTTPDSVDANDNYIDAKTINSDTIHVSTLYIKELVLVDENDNIRGWFKTKGDQVSLSLNGTKGQMLVYIVGDDEGASILLGEPDNAPQIYISSSKELGSAIILYDENENVVWSSFR